MTKDEIEKMEAGREMDALIAENIMGWKRDWYWVNSATKSEDLMYQRIAESMATVL